MNNMSINKYCPRSGKAVTSDSLIKYKDFTVGFCNTGCRDDFVQNITERPKDVAYFDSIIIENNLDLYGHLYGFKKTDQM